MRLLERLIYFTACLLCVAIASQEKGLIVELIYDAVIGLIMLGWWVEGFRLSQLPFCAVFMLQ